MEVLLLGTGAADGWPNPFCRCVSCTDARERGEVRGQTAALVDDVIALDLGPEAPAAASRHGVDLADVRHLLFTHAHSDHLGPQALLHRSWVDGAGPLEVVGPASVVSACRSWVGPRDPVAFVEVQPGDVLDLGTHRVRVLPAAHHVFETGDAVLYDVTGPDGARLLWACDTGLWPEPWSDAVTHAAYDTVLIEETHGDVTGLGDGHLHLGTFATMLQRLRACGAVTDATDVVAVHLSHHNPPLEELRARLEALDARPGTDGERLGVAAGVAPS